MVKTAKRAEPRGKAFPLIINIHVSIPANCQETIKEYTKKIAESLHVCGLMNMQYAIENGKVYVIEANPRASRTVPLVSKVCDTQMAPLQPE